jgi:hypothetical protein
LTHFLKALPYIPRLYTLYFAHYTRKITPKSDFSCTSQKKSVSLQPNEFKTMSIPKIHSIQSISAKYNTGDEPVLVLCSDKRQYICKYMRSSATIAYKLACEYIGAKLAAIWKINTPPVALVNILPAHWETVNVTHSLSAPAIGYQKLENVIDITPTFTQIAANKKTLLQLLKIALFDFWITNEDRTYNNANLLYDLENEDLVSIDYGGILNNVSFDYSSQQLTETDSILCADLSAHLLASVTIKDIESALPILYAEYLRSVNTARKQINSISQEMPKEWALPTNKILAKLTELVEPQWVEDTWNNFIECLKSNSNYGK